MARVAHGGGQRASARTAGARLEQLGQRFAHQLEPFAARGRNRDGPPRLAIQQRLDVARLRDARPIQLVQRDEHAFARERRGDLAIVHRQRLRAIDDPQNDRALFDRFARDACDRLDSSAVCATCDVDNVKIQRPDRLAHAIACGARKWVIARSSPSSAMSFPTFGRPRSARVHHAHARARQLPGPLRQIRSRHDVLRHLDATDVLREVDPRLDFGDGIRHALAQRVEPARQSTRELRHRECSRLFGFGGDQIRHRFRAREIETSVHERSQRELAGPRQPRPRGDQRREHGARGQRATVTRQLDDVFACVRARRAEHRRHHFVEALFAAASPAVVQGVAVGVRERYRAMKHAVADRERVPAAHSDDRESGAAGRGRDRGVVSSRCMGRILARLASRTRRKAQRLVYARTAWVRKSSPFRQNAGPSLLRGRTVCAKHSSQLKRLFEAYDLAMVRSLLTWDQTTYMPKGGAPARGRQVSLLGRRAHEVFTDKEVGRLLDQLEPWAAKEPYDSDEAALIRVTRREYDRATRVPSSFVAEMNRTSRTYQAWTAARRNDFAAVRRCSGTQSR